MYGSSGGIFDKIQIDLGLHDNLQDLLVRFRLETDAGEHDNGVYIDDVVIGAMTPGDDYEYFPGTSMAAPHVSGLAGLIMAAFPTLANSGVKNRILNGVNAKPSLVGITVSGGRINAMGSLSIPIAPGGLVARAVSANQVNLSWTDNSGPPWAEETGFPVYRKTEGESNNYILVGTVGGVPGVGNIITFADGTVVPGQMYIYKVTANNLYGDSESTNESTALTPGGNTGSSSGGGGCFIATAAYGSPTARFIHLFRAFRDQYLLANPIGKKWTDLYYRCSPPVAGFVADRPALRKGLRLILFPFVAFSAGMVHTTTPQKWLIFCFVGGFLAGMALLSKRRILNCPSPMR